MDAQFVNYEGVFKKSLTYSRINMRIIRTFEKRLSFERHQKTCRSDALVRGAEYAQPLSKLRTIAAGFQDIRPRRDQRSHPGVCDHPFPEHFVYVWIGNQLFPVCAAQQSAGPVQYAEPFNYCHRRPVHGHPVRVQDPGHAVPGTGR